MLDRDQLPLFFCGVMASKLQENAHKGAWWHCKPSWLLRRLETEVRELRRAVQRRAPAKELWREAADVGNFAAMVADVMEDRERRRGGGTFRIGA